jgi:AraC-like DNA-binding protein
MQTAVLEDGGGARKEADSLLVERVAEYIELHYAEPISLRDVAAIVGYSGCHLTTIFRRSTGLPVTAWIIRRRILAAQQLLARGEVTVASTCEAVGFTDLCYFTRQFVRHTGVTPGRFRASKKKRGMFVVSAERERHVA